MQSDPIGLAGGLNTYGYAGGNPTNFVDPFGLLETTLEAFCARNPAQCLAVLIGTGAGLSPTTLSILKSMPDTADPCADLQAQIRARVEELKQRRAEMLADRFDLYSFARDKPSPALPKGAGSWKGHQIQFYSKQQNLAYLIQAAAEIGCLVPVDAWFWANTAPPTAPQRFGGR